MAEKILARGISACPGVVSGRAKVVLGIGDLGKIKKGDIIVLLCMFPGCAIIMDKLAGIVAERGSLTCHTSIVSREFGIPCVVAAENATKSIKDRQRIRLDAEKGEVYEC